MAQKRKPNLFPVVKNHIKRVATFFWDKLLLDPRSKINQKLDFHYAINTLFLGILSGMKNLREIETFSEICSKRIPDTTLNNLIIEVDAEPLRQMLAKEVKSALRNHELPKEQFPVRVTAIDGKCLSVSSQAIGPFSQASACNGSVQYLNRALRAFHVSNNTTLCIGQREIHGKAAEMSEFQPFVQSLIQDYSSTSLMEVISVDAGMTSKANADFLIAQNLNYIMALKRGQQTLWNTASNLLDSRSQADKVITENINGKSTTREFYRCSVELNAQHGWSHLKEFWRIKQTSITLRTGEQEIQERYFLSSLPKDTLTNAQAMQAIRMHWRIENNGNWVTDTAFGEDDAPFANHALVLISLLRMLAYNVISRLKTRRLRKAQARAMSWPDIMKLIEHAVVQLIFSEQISAEKQPAFV
jgi:predicted transposase YbfD/YdcC